MVIDRLENIEKYTLLHPLFEQAIDFLKSHDLHSLEIGKTELTFARFNSIIKSPIFPRLMLS